MPDASTVPDDLDRAPPRMQRAAGRALVRLGPGARLEALEQAGCAKAFLPRVGGVAPEVVFLNTAGGLTGGDSLSYALALAADATATATTQTAERGYRSAAGTAGMVVTLSAGAGAVLDWLPQETILFDRAALDRHSRIDLGPGARLVWAEMLVLGRAAMGERVAGLALSDRREVWRDGRPAMIEPVRLSGGALAGPEGAARPALTGGLRAFATVALFAPGAEAALGPLRAALPAQDAGLEAAASAWDGRCLLRVAASDALPMKRAVAAALHVLRGGRALPRVWQV
jgi:urease accessory protein